VLVKFDKISFFFLNFLEFVSVQLSAEVISD